MNEFFAAHRFSGGGGEFFQKSMVRSEGRIFSEDDSNPVPSSDIEPRLFRGFVGEVACGLCQKNLSCMMSNFTMDRRIFWPTRIMSSSSFIVTQR